MLTLPLLIGYYGSSNCKSFISSIVERRNLIEKLILFDYRNWVKLVAVNTYRMLLFCRKNSGIDLKSVFIEIFC